MYFSLAQLILMQDMILRAMERQCVISHAEEELLTKIHNELIARGASQHVTLFGPEYNSGSVVTGRVVSQCPAGTFSTPKIKKE